jgi:hypothetical protein
LAISILVGVYLVHGRYIFITCLGMLSLTVYPLYHMKVYAGAANDLARVKEEEFEQKQHEPKWCFS